MATELTLPRLGQGMESGTIVRWLKSEGDSVEKGEALYELDTEKVTQEVEADAGGVLLRILAQEGEEIEVGKPVAVVGEKGEEIADEPAAGGEATDGRAARPVEEDVAEEGSPGEARAPERERGRAASAEPAEPAERETEVKEPAVPRADGGRVKASPLARRIARERGIELVGITGTGPEGRVVAEDVERAAATVAPAPAAPGAPAEAVEVEKLSTLRRTLARRLTQGWEVPAFQISMTADMTRAQALRERLVERAEGTRPTVTDVLTKACAAALMRHRAVNARFAEDAVELYATANIGLAVAIQKGLIVPVIPACEAKSISELAAAREALVERARQGKLQQADLEGGTFTISNLGMYGVEEFVAVLNPPQAAILAVGAIEPRPRVEAGEVVVRPLMHMTLTCDHRAVDGATAAEFLGTVKAFLEEPGLML
jgi:pyruvate dehydrogenase E2 component (dihydrolipoamide acetyltransferase)